MRDGSSFPSNRRVVVCPGSACGPRPSPNTAYRFGQPPDGKSWRNHAKRRHRNAVSANHLCQNPRSLPFLRNALRPTLPAWHAPHRNRPQPAAQGKCPATASTTDLRQTAEPCGGYTAPAPQIASGRCNAYQRLSVFAQARKSSGQVSTGFPIALRRPNPWPPWVKR